MYGRGVSNVRLSYRGRGRGARGARVSRLRHARTLSLTLPIHSAHQRHDMYPCARCPMCALDVRDLGDLAVSRGMSTLHARSWVIRSLSRERARTEIGVRTSLSQSLTHASHRRTASASEPSFPLRASSAPTSLHRHGSKAVNVWPPRHRVSRTRIYNVIWPSLRGHDSVIG